MEGEVVTAAAALYPGDAMSAADTDLGSPEERSPPEPRLQSDEDDRDPEQEPNHGQDVDPDSGTAVLTGDDLKQRIIKQARSLSLSLSMLLFFNLVRIRKRGTRALYFSAPSHQKRDNSELCVEYYFSDENLPTDKYMLNLMKKTKEGFVPIGVIGSFRKMKKLSRDHAFISAALKESTFLVVSPDGKKVRRLNPLPVVEVRDHKLFTVLVENLPEDHSVENLKKIFGEVGKVKKISIHDANATEETKKGNRALYRSKLHALVEYEATEAAEKAANTLNNEEDWRNGMRVKLLKRLGKYGQRKAWSGSESDKKTVSRSPDHAGDGENNSKENHEHHEETPDEEDGDHVGKDKSGERGKNHGNHGRGRRHKHRGLNGHGHGNIAAPQVIEASKPPPGPKMPDGTRGFAMGRGRPLSSDRS
ncbi:hypothetical protein CDL15_Pgr006153 [Punica granatum]|uniref:La-related protein 6A n=1 Tax=Punica granatum TaxID=22663 RepID=A0A218VV46_PUNGR|nr:hypothetical protein CDL15_Pgr006153 [Punica granatum]